MSFSAKKYWKAFGDLSRVSKRRRRSNATISASVSLEQMPPVREVHVALCYLRQVICSRNQLLISKSATALLDAVDLHCDVSDKRLQEGLERLLRCIDQYIASEKDVHTEALMIAVAEVTSAITDCPSKKPTASATTADFKARDPSPEAPRATISEMEDPDIDNLLKQLNIRQVPKFSPQFPDLGGDSDEEGPVTTEEKEERAEKHGQKMCEEEVQKMPDGTEVRMKKTRTMNVSQSSKHVTISTRGGGQPTITRMFRDGGKSFNDDEEEENDDFFGRNPFARFRERNPLSELDATSAQVEPGQSTKTKTLERTSEVSQSKTQKKEKNGKVLAEQAASKLDTSELHGKFILTFKGGAMVDKTGDGSYEESSTIQRGLPANGPQPVPPPRKQVIEYMHTFGSKDNSDVDYLRGSTLSSYIQLNDNLRFHEEQFRKKLQFEFSAAGTSTSTTPDFASLAELLQGSEFGAIQLPTKWTNDFEEDTTQKAIDWQERKAIGYLQDTVCSLDATDYLVMRAKDDCSKATEVRGGPRDALLVYATQSSSPLIYQEAFLVTYRTFISSVDLINKLVTRYLHMSASTDRSSQSAAKHTFSVLVRVVDELNAIELQQALVDSSTSFVYRLIREGNFTFARILRRRLLERIEDRTEKGPNPTIPKAPSKKSTTLFDFRSSVIAAQMTTIDAQLFQLIEPAELLWWAQDQDVTKSPNLVAFTENFNNVSFWVRSLVISQATAKERERFMNKFIKVMKHLRQLCNFNSYLAVLSALVSSPLSRLDWSSNITSTLKEHAEIMDTSGSYKNYRQLLASATPPCVPYIGVVLQDLTFVNAGNPNTIPAERCQGRPNMINFLKRWHQYAILESVRKMKRWNYDVKRDERLIGFFNSFKNYMDEDKTWKRSFDIKASKRREAPAAE